MNFVYYPYQPNTLHIWYFGNEPGQSKFALLLSYIYPSERHQGNQGKKILHRIPQDVEGPLLEALMVRSNRIVVKIILWQCHSRRVTWEASYVAKESKGFISGFVEIVGVGPCPVSHNIRWYEMVIYVWAKYCSIEEGHGPLPADTGRRGMPSSLVV